jgi:hypothetical protein
MRLSGRRIVLGSSLVIIASLCAHLAVAAELGSWPQFRGGNGEGHYPKEKPGADVPKPILSSTL